VATEFVDYYVLLGVTPAADLATIRRAFIAKAKEHHPDAGGTTEYMQQLNTAYKTLISPNSKGAYDMMHSFHTGRAQSEYHYADDREVNDITDMSDEEIDSFLDDLLKEYRNGPPKTKQSIKDRIRKYFEL